MNQQVERGYQMHRVLSNLSRLDVGQLDDADQERVETARWSFVTMRTPSNGAAAPV
jgi:hypothetical protein